MKTTIFAALLFCLAGVFYGSGAAAQYRQHGRSDYRSYHTYNRDYGYAYRRPYTAYPRYSYPRYYGGGGVSVIASLPLGAISVHIGATPYHYYRGLFYRPYGPRFIITAPPVGIIVPVLPPGCVPVIINGMECYSYSGTYYQPLANNQGYQVIEGQQPSTNNDDAVSDSDSTTYEKVVIDGKTYYRKGDTYYKAIVSDSGEVTYEAVGETGK